MECRRKTPISVLPVPHRYPARIAGFNLVELLLGIAILGVLAAIGYPSYTQHMEKTRNATAVSDIIQIDQAIERFYVRNSRLPDSLAEAGVGALFDPWDNAYRYLRIAGSGIKDKGSLRKDKALNPINTDYDLYSMGKDEKTKLPFTNSVSFDDIVRCNNGRYIGLAADY